MNNEPVAYGMFIDGDFYDAIHADEYKRVEGKYDIPLYTHPVKELDESFRKGFEAGKEEGWKAHKFHHPVKELHLSLQKSKQTGELLAVTYTDDEHRIVEVLWQKPPALTDEEIISTMVQFDVYSSDDHCLIEAGRAILRKAQEK